MNGEGETAVINASNFAEGGIVWIYENGVCVAQKFNRGCPSLKRGDVDRWSVYQ